MAISQDLLDALVRIDTATSDIAQRVAELAERIGTGMTAEDVSSVVTQLNEAASDLDSIAADPTNPVPTT